MALVLTDVPERYIRTASDREAVRRGYRWSQQAVDHVLRFAATLRNPMDPSQPYRLLRWQLEDVVVPLFGWRRPDGRRRFNRHILFVPKKNGKTSLLAFLNLAFLLADGEPRPGCYVVSTTAENSDSLYEESRRMLGDCGEHQARFRTAWLRVAKPVDYTHTIECTANGGELKALTASPRNAEGLKGSLVCIDEAHETLQARPKLYGALRYAGSGRRQPLAAVISTAGDSVQGLPYEVYTRAKRIIAGTDVDLHTLAVVYEAPQQAEYTDKDLAAANPGVGEVLTVEQLREDYQSAQANPFELSGFLRYRLGQWVKRATAWLNRGEWDTHARRGVDDSLLIGRPCWAGVDLSSRRDLTAAVVMWLLEDGTEFYRPHFWLPAEGIEERCRREMDYAGAAAAGHMTLCPGRAVNYQLVREWLCQHRTRYGLATIGFDPAKAKALADELQTLDGFTCYGVPQGWNLSEPALEWETSLATGTIAHDANPVLAWCIENVECIRDLNGKVRPVKPLGEVHKRIDGVIAAVIAKYLRMFSGKSEEFFCG